MTYLPAVCLFVTTPCDLATGARLGTSDEEIKDTYPLVGAQGYQMFPPSKPVVGQTIHEHAVPAYRAYIPT